MKRQRFDSCHYLGWNNSKRHCVGVNDEPVHVPPPASLTRKRHRHDDVVEETPMAKRLHMCPATPNIPPPPPSIVHPSQEKIVTIPESIVLGIWNHRNELMKHVEQLKTIISQLRAYINMNDTGGQRSFNTSLVCVET